MQKKRKKNWEETFLFEDDGIHCQIFYSFDKKKKEWRILIKNRLIRTKNEN